MPFVLLLTTTVSATPTSWSVSTNFLVNCLLKVLSVHDCSDLTTAVSCPVRGHNFDSWFTRIHPTRKSAVKSLGNTNITWLCWKPYRLDLGCWLGPPFRLFTVCRAFRTCAVAVPFPDSVIWSSSGAECRFKSVCPSWWWGERFVFLLVFGRTSGTSSSKMSRVERRSVFPPGGPTNASELMIKSPYILRIRALFSSMNPSIFSLLQNAYNNDKYYCTKQVIFCTLKKSKDLTVDSWFQQMGSIVD